MASTFLNIPGNGSPSWKDPVNTSTSLPLLGNNIGDARVTQDTSSIYIWSGSAWVQVSGGGGGSGNVVGPASSTTNAIASYADGTGKLIQDSGVTISGTSPIVITPEAVHNLQILGANNGAGAGSTVTITGGTGSTNGGAVAIQGGVGANNGASVTITSGTTTSTTLPSGGVTIAAGTVSTSATATPGLVTLKGGTATGGGFGGNVLVSGGSIIAIRLRNYS